MKKLFKIKRGPFAPVSGDLYYGTTFAEMNARNRMNDRKVRCRGLDCKRLRTHP